MKQKFLVFAFFLATTLIITSCNQRVASGDRKNEAGEESHSEQTEGGGEHGSDGSEEARGEHARDEGGGGEGEEKGTRLTLNEVYDEVRKGAHLILKYDKSSNSFIGTVKNTTNENLPRVRVEVHLSNGKELGPTVPIDLAPGMSKEVVLKATSKDFSNWTTHAEVGNSEHGESGEEGEEHGQEGQDGHN